MLKIYVCECGATFTEPNRFNGHKSNCKIRLQRLGKLDDYYNSKKRQAKTGSETRHQIAIQKSKDLLASWISERHICEHCGKVMTEKFESGRFCSRACANSREFSDASKAKKSEAIRGSKAISNGHIVKYISKDDDIPTGFLPTSYFNRKTRTLKSEDKQTDNLHITKQRSPSFKSLLAEYHDILQEYNNKILSEYELILQEKCKNRIFNIGDRRLYMFAQYFAVTKEDTDLSVEKFFNSNSVFVHTLVAEQLLERPILLGEIVHHKNHIKLDNRFENIYVFDSKSSHARFHYGNNFVLQIDVDRLVCKPLTKELLLKIVSKSK